jgi:hypothetical protein
MNQPLSIPLVVVYRVEPVAGKFSAVRYNKMFCDEERVDRHVIGRYEDANEALSSMLRASTMFRARCILRGWRCRIIRELPGATLFDRGVPLSEPTL